MEQQYIIDVIRPLIGSLRRGESIEENWRLFSHTIEGNLDRIFSELSTRWLVSIADTYVDFGNSIERRNAMFIDILANMEKIAQSYLLYKLNYTGAFDVPEDHAYRKLFIWDGMTTMHFATGDVSNNMFRRLHILMAETPLLQRIFKEMLRRMEIGPTILGTINRLHGHVFDATLEWREHENYDPWRVMGHLPTPENRPLKREKDNLVEKRGRLRSDIARLDGENASHEDRLNLKNLREELRQTNHLIKKVQAEMDALNSVYGPE